MTTRAPRAASSLRARRGFGGFVLLEVLVSMAILGVSLTMILRSFTVSIKAARRSRDTTVASTLARNLIEEWETQPPAPGNLGGDFGPQYPRFSYKGVYRREEIRYEDVSELEGLGRLNYLNRITLDVYLAAGRGERSKPNRILHVETALLGAEKYSQISRILNQIGFDN